MRKNGPSLAKLMPKMIFPLGLFTLDGAKGCKETNLYPIPVLGTQTFARKNISTYSLNDLLEVCQKRVFQGRMRRQNIGSTEAESDLSTNKCNIKGSLVYNKITLINLEFSLRENI